MNNFAKIISALLLFASTPVDAVLIQITYPELDVVRATLSEIDAVDDRVYSVRLNEDGTANIQFGDGTQGSRPSSGGNVVASYRLGGGIEGKIVNEYAITETELPFIPIEDFWPTGANQPDISFVIVGLASMTFDFSADGLRVIDAKPLQSSVPAPPGLLLFFTGLIGLAGFRIPGRS